MGVISGIREKLHFVLYALMAAFLALIVFEWGMNFSGPTGGGSIAGKVNGRPIGYQQYERTYESITDNWRNRNPQADLTDAIEMQLRMQAWDIVVNEIILQEQFEKYAIRVSDDEIVAAVESDNPPQIIVRNFADQETGSIDREKLEKAREAPGNREAWLMIEDIIRRELMQQKLDRTLGGMVRVSDAELDAVADREYGVFSASFLVLPYSAAGADSLFSVSDKDIGTYYEENRELYRQEPTRTLDYVVFSAEPSGRDSMTVKTELESLRDAFAEAEDDSAFVKLQSDLAETFDRQYSRADFSVGAAEAVFGKTGPAAGDLIGPVADQNRYRMIKVQAVSEGEPVVRASHILVSFARNDADSKSKAENTVSDIMTRLRAGDDFASLARQYSEDEVSAGKGGDLGWFEKGAMVPEFDKAVFSSKPGSLVGPVETAFGLHIIRVTGKDTRRITGSEVVRNIRPSDATLEKARRRAALFQMEAEDRGFDTAVGSFQTKAQKTGAFTREDVLPGLGYQHAITRFAFSSSKDAVSDVIRHDKGFLVLRVSGINNSGYRELDDELVEDIRKHLLKEKKGDVLDEKLSLVAKEKEGNLEAIASAFDGVRVVKAENTGFKQRFIPGYGNDLRLIEAIIGMEPGEVSEPVPVSEGRALIVLQGKTYQEKDIEAAKLALRPLLLPIKRQRFVLDYLEAERRSAVIEDMRRL